LQAPSSTHTQSGENVLFGTARALCSAASQYYLWDSQVAHPERTLCDPKSRKVHLADGVSPTDAMGYGLMAMGMSTKCMGDESKPHIALTVRQILWIVDCLEIQWITCFWHLLDSSLNCRCSGGQSLWVAWMASISGAFFPHLGRCSDNSTMQWTASGAAFQHLCH
jgi:hypothetical protein